MLLSTVGMSSFTLVMDQLCPSHTLILFISHPLPFSFYLIKFFVSLLFKRILYQSINYVLTMTFSSNSLLTLSMLRTANWGRCFFTRQQMMVYTPSHNWLHHHQLKPIFSRFLYGTQDLAILPSNLLPISFSNIIYLISIL